MFGKLYTHISGVGGEREAEEGGDICEHTADSLCCIAETNNVKQLCKLYIFIVY